MRTSPSDASITKIITAINNHRQHEPLAPFDCCVDKDCREAIGLLRTLHQESFALNEMMAANRRQHRAWIIMMAIGVAVWAVQWFSR